MSTLVITIISLCAIGVVSAVILYFVAQKFKVEEDPRIDIVEGLLPGANCGGCGYPGCRGLAEAAVKSETMEGILCPVGGAETMNKVAAALGREVKAQAPKIAVVRCNGTCENRPRTQPIRRSPFLCHRTFLICRRYSLRIRLSGMWRLCCSLPVRCDTHGFYDIIACSRR